MSPQGYRQIRPIKPSAYVPYGRVEAPEIEPDPEISQLVREGVQEGLRMAHDYELPQESQSQTQPSEQTTPRPAVDPITQLKNIQKANAYLDMAYSKDPESQKNPDVTKDYDAEPHGFDESDKLSMMGSLLVGGGTGVTDTVARVVQILGKLERPAAKIGMGMLSTVAPPQVTEAISGPVKKISDFFAGGSEDFTDWYNRAKSRNTVVQRAMVFHPVMYDIGNFLGSTAASYLLTAGAGLGAKAVSEATEAPEIIANISSAIKSGSGKAVLNSKYLSKALWLAKNAGKGAFIGETQYDPEDNHYISQGVIGAIFGLAFPYAGKLMGKLSRPITQNISDIMQKYNISLPVYSSMEKLARYLPLSGYKAAITQRAQQVEGVGTKMFEDVTSQAKESILSDLQTRELALQNQLAQPDLDDYTQRALSKSLDILSQQRKSLGQASGYDAFLAGKLRQSYLQGKDQASKMYDQVADAMKDAPPIEMMNTKELVQSINKQQQNIFNGLRNSRLINIAKNVMQSSELKDKLESVGLKTPEQMVEAINGILDGKFNPNSDIPKTIMPIMGDVNNILFREGYTQPIRNITDPLNFLSDKARMSYQDFKVNKTLVGGTIDKATNDMDRGNYKQLYDAMTADLNEHVKTYGGKDTLSLLKKANEIYSSRVAPFKSPPLNPFRTDDYNSDNFIGKFFRPDQPQTARDILSMMPEGDKTAKLAVKAAIMNEAYSRAFNPNVGLNPVKFINSLKSLGETNNVIFSKEENAVFDGYKNLIDIVQRISPKAVMPETARQIPTMEEPTGKILKGKMIGSAVGSAAMIGGFYTGHAPALLALLMAGTTFGKLVTSDIGRKLMMQCSKLGEKTTMDEFNPILKQIIKVVGTYGGVKATESSMRGT